MRMTTLMLTNRHLRDLNPILAGAENCEPGHAFGPAVRISAATLAYAGE